MPSRSPGRGVRVVYDTDSRMPRSRSSSARVRLVLPPPDGAAITNRFPVGVMQAPCRGFLAASFDILDLFPHLLDQHLEFQRRLRQLGVDGFRAQRVRFAVE